MPPRKKEAPPQAANLEIGSLFEQELQSLNENLRSKATMAMFKKLQPNNTITVEQFLGMLKQHKDVWSAVNNMGIVDFADAINDGQRLREVQKRETRGEGRRTRLNDNQKQALKALVVRVLSDSKEGLNRGQLSRSMSTDQVLNLGVERDELANKLRQPLGELVREGRIHTVGEKRLLKYFMGAAQGSHNAPSSSGKQSRK